VFISHFHCHAGLEPASRGAKAVSNVKQRRFYAKKNVFKIFKLGNLKSIINVYKYIIKLKRFFFSVIYYLRTPGCRLKAGMTMFGRVNNV
jgi:hypothetical protein